MRFSKTVLMLMLVSVVALANECDNVSCDGKVFHWGSPGPVAIAMHVTALAVMAADMSTTMDIPHHKGAYEGDSIARAVIGRYPSEGAVLATGIVVMMAHTAAWYFAPREVRAVMDVLTIGIEAVVVTGNLSMGLRFRI